MTFKLPSPVFAENEPMVAPFYPNTSTEWGNAWINGTDNCIVLFESVRNAVLFSTSEGYKYEGAVEGVDWERLSICGNKQVLGFRFRELENMLENNPNCCRQVEICLFRSGEITNL